ncbi:MAG: hypothetical protein ABI411_19180 [Tahibacter sp.]
MCSAGKSRIPLLLATVFAAVAPMAGAKTFAVGRGAGCTHTTIQSAIDAAKANRGADTIRITRSLRYTRQALVVDTRESLAILGGFAQCNQAASDGNATTIDGAGGATDPVVRIAADTGALVQLDGLTIQGGDEDGDGYGGGIYFRGNGILDINHSTISANVAGYGGGIYAWGTGREAELVIGEGVQISSNVARYSGGGVYVEGLEMSMLGADSWIAFNRATGVLEASTGNWQGGYAGGLMVLSGALPAYAYVGSSGIGQAGPIYFNEARYGGGVAVVAHQTTAELDLFTTDPTRPMRVKSNHARVAGGAIYQSNPGDGVSNVRADYTFVEDNAAPRGAAIYANYQDAWIGFNTGATHVAARACPLNLICGGIIGNFGDENGQPSGGIIERGDLAPAWFERIAISGNSARNLIRAIGDGSDDEIVDVSTHNVLITDNQVSETLIASDDASWRDQTGRLHLEDTTIAGNLIGGDAVLHISNKPNIPGSIRRSIVWQPGKATLQSTGARFDVVDVIASEVDSLQAGRNGQLADPRFVDPERSDFRLRAGSPAVDATTVNDAGGTRDVFGLLRNYDLPPVPNLGGLRDIGAIERREIMPLLVNPDFDNDYHLWTDDNAISTWDNSQNAAGQAGSGSIRVTQSTALPIIVGLSQCVHVPGPGTYALNGWGRSGAGALANRDYVYLYWEVRRDGGEDCNSGAPDASGRHFLSSQNAWRKPESPALIDVPGGEWTRMASIKITLVVAENGITWPPTTIGWFDGISLELLP